MATLLLLIAVVLMGCCAFGVERVKGTHLGWLGLTVYASIGLLAFL